MSLKIIIRKGETSRWIEAPFNLVGSRADLRELAHQILNQTASEDFNYGTLYITERIVYGTANTEPSPWEDKS